jgi:hypothetical protein
MTAENGLAIVLVLVAVQDLSGQLRSNQPSINVKDARQLVITALPSRTTSLPGFGLEQAKNNNYPDRFFFEATWDNPKGSVVVGHYAVDPRTGDVWNAIVCEELKSPSLKTLQQRVRKRLGLTEREYRKLRRPGPMCEIPDGTK